MRVLSPSLYKNLEFQSAMVRLAIWCVAVIYVSAGVLSDRYDVDINSFFILFAAYLLFFISILISVVIRPVFEERVYASLIVDVSAATVCIYLTGEASSPFFLFYIWIFVSYGMRFGRWHLTAASILSILAFSAVLTLLGQWGEYFFEASFVLLVLVVLPIYQHSLMEQLQMARSDAESSNRMVGRFLASMTNEMRGPLVDIVATSKDLSALKLNMEQLDKVDDIKSSASLLDSLIGDVLDFHKLESEQLHLQSVPFDMHAVITEVCSALVKTAVARKIELVCSVASGVPRIVVGDEQRLKQALTNILKSAINSCLGDELQVRVQIDSSNLEMLLFEIKGIASLVSEEDMDFDDDSMVTSGISDAKEELSPDLGNSFACRLISLMGGKFGVGSREDGVICWFNFPAITDDYEGGKAFKQSSLQGKKAFIIETNKTSRDEIVRCCVEQKMSVETVDRVAELSGSISGLRESRDVDIIIIADSPTGKGLARIIDICHDVLGGDLPLVVLAYRRNCLDLTKYGSAVLIRKPFIHDQLVDAMEMALIGR